MLLPLLLASAWLATPLDDLGAKYHLRVEVLSSPLDWKGNGYAVHARPATGEQVDNYAPTLIAEWSLYPPSFVKKAKVVKIVIGKDLAVNEQFRSAVPAFDGAAMYYDPVLGSSNTHYQRVVVHHEFFHMVDWRMGTLAPDYLWWSANPTSFHYGTGGANMRTSGVGDLTDTLPGFLTMYGTSAVEEDKAELFAHLIVDGDFVARRALVDPVLAKKISMLKVRMLKFDQAMDEQFWKRAAAMPR